ncbi:MAG: hypothetical protein ACXAD7_03370 [Candidatus Kariarchaeaceae archaeon]|jgi:hypothetical protein
MSETVEEKPKKSNFLVRLVKSQGVKFLVLIFIISDLLAIMLISEEITPNRPTLDAIDVILFESDHLILIGLSSVLLITLVVLFTKMIFGDQREDFGITSYKSWRAFWFLILIIVFLSCVFVLLDVALLNIYLLLPSVDIIWKINDTYDLFEEIPSETDFEAYANIRGKIFAGLFLFLMIFPVLMFLIILTRFGRSRLFRDTEGGEEFSLKFYLAIFRIFTLIILALGAILIIYISFLYPGSFADIAPIVGSLVVFSILLFVGFLIVIDILRRVFHFTSMNLLMFFPILFLFYIIPVLGWSAWDIYVVVTDGDLAKTIYDSVTLDDALRDDLPQLYYETFLLNLQAIDRIIELDFVMIIGLSSLIIGFAEGYSLLSIGRSIFRGKAVLRSGRIARKSSSPGVVRVSRSVMLMAWLGMLWDKALEIIQVIFDQFDLSYEFTLDVPTLFDLAYSIPFDAYEGNNFMLLLALLLIPTIIIINSSFKFLSVSLVISKTKEDTQAFFLLISSTFVLIVTKIFVDITSIEIFENEYKSILPFRTLTSSNFLVFAMNAFTNLEAIAFYVGVIVVLIYGIPKAIFGKGQDETSEI